jgi:hypothetical protein
MNRTQSSGSEYSAARAFARVGLERLLAKLYLYATGTLHLAAIGAERGGVVEAGDVVNTLIEKGFSGTLAWTLPEDATEEQIVGLACMKLRGMHWTLRRQAARTLGDDALDERADPSPDALARLMVERGLADLAGAVQHDAEATAYLRGMLAGETRAEIADELGWTADRAKVVRKRILRGVAALSARMNEDSEVLRGTAGPCSPRS